MARVDHVEEQVCFRHLFERGTEGRHEVVRELSDEPHRVDHDDLLREALHAELSEGRIQRGEKAVFDLGFRRRETVHERRFARVGVAHEGDFEGVPATAGLHLAGRRDVSELIGEQGDALANDAAVRLELGFAHAPRADTAGLTREVRPRPGEAGQEIGILGQVDLSARFTRARPAGENIQNDRGAVAHADFQDLFEIPHLCWSQFIVEDGQPDLFRLAQP